jgi:molecular chaperone DnaK
LEQLVDDLIDRTVEPCHKALADAGIKSEDVDEVVLVGGMTRMPKVQELVKKLFGKEPHKGVNPDEVVAVGAAIQAGVLKGEVKDILLLDVTPLSLGIETLGGVFTKIIERNTTIPTRKKEIFSTAADNQTEVEIHVLQGEREMAADNKTLGRFHLVGIPPAPRGVPKIEVTFDIDANGILQVTAKDTATGKDQKITITASSGLSKEEVERLVQEAKEHEEEDRRRREEVETFNQADTLIYTTEKTMREFGDKLNETDKKNIEEAISNLKKALEKKDVNAVKKGMEELSKAAQKIGEEMYKQSATQHQTQTGTASSQSQEKTKKDNEDVIDGEYKVEDK